MELTPEFLMFFVIHWLEFAVRWLHVITAIAWIGSSFYFIALDLGLRRTPNLPKDAHGEEWQVHGGGFYHIQKYLVAPATLPEHLIWFKWESYVTWLSGAALMVIVYYLGSDLTLIDIEKADISAATAIGLSVASIVIGWLFYDRLCRSPLGKNSTVLMVILYGLIIALSFGFDQIFTGRASFLHLGAITATIMTANVFMVIIPNQRIVVADLKAGRVPDAKYGVIAKQRSTHNNYLTLPVIFLMLSNHYPLAFATQYSWIIAALVFLMGVTIRHYFNSIHAGKGNPRWTWAATAGIFFLIMALSIAPLLKTSDSGTDDEAEWDTTWLTGDAKRLANHPDFEAAVDVVMGRCSMCHTAEPFFEGVITPPKNIRLDTPTQIARHGWDVVLHSGVSRAMPPANVSFMEEEERALLRRWFQESLSQ